MIGQTISHCSIVCKPGVIWKDAVRRSLTDECKRSCVQENPELVSLSMTRQNLQFYGQNLSDSIEMRQNSVLVGG